jgi:PKD repeat protein
MKKRNLIVALSIVASIAISGFTIVNYYHANGNEVAMTNSPHDGSGDCTNCHNGGSVTPTITLTATPAFVNNTYVPGTVYTLSYKVTGYPKFGFDFEINAGNTTTSMGAGTLAALTNSHVTANPYSQGYPANVSQSSAISSSSSATWHWTAPASGTVYVYSVGLGVNGNGSDTGDKMQQYNLILTPASAGSAPVANFTAANTTICAGQSIAFTDQSTNTPTSWAWSFTGGTPATSTSQNPTITYNTAGTYTVALTATNGSGSNTKTQTNYITVKVIPAAPTASSNTPICAGGTINLTTPTVTGATYAWTGPSSFTSSSQNPTRASATTAMGGTYSLTETVNGCTSPAGTTSVVVNGASVTPSVSIAITSGGNPTCNGQSVTFTASPTNGGTTPVYQWKLNGTNVGTNSVNYTNTSLTNGAVVTCVMTSNNSCASPLTATSNAITMSITTTVAPAIAIAITSGSNPTCAGQPITFTASPTNGGTTPSYHWKLNGSTNVGTDSPTFTTSSLTNNSVISCIMTSNSSCASPTTATSNGITITVGSTVAPTVAIAATSGSTTICSGQPVTITATPTNGGSTPTYQWKVNGLTTGTNSNTYTDSSPANGDVITCIMTSNSGCANPLTATSNAVSLTVSTSVTPSVAAVITNGSNPSCSGQPVTFSASPTNGGSTPTYQWLLNGSVVSTDSTYTNNTPASGDIVSCSMTSSSGCASPSTATATSITMTVNDSTVAPTVDIVGNPSICAGQPLLLTANATNGGATPSYQWKLNGSFWGDGTANCVYNTPANGDIITCIMTSSSSCANPSVAISNLVTVVINNGPPAMPSVTFDGTTLTSSATTGNQWFLNGVEIPGATDQYYAVTANGSYQVGVSNGCALAISDPTNVTTAGIDELSAINAVTLYPNPNDGNFTISFLVNEKTTYKIQIISTLGQVVYKDEVTDFTGTYSKQLNVKEFGKGLYSVTIMNSTKSVLKKLIVY